MLYRPFLHYISPRLSTGKVVDDRYYACAAAGISVSRNIIHIAMEIKDQVLVVGPFWSMLYTEFFAILALVFYALENPDKQGSTEIYADANAGREMIAKMALRSFAADRITSSLSSLWENLPESIKNGSTRALPTRKRSAPGQKQGPVPLPAHKTTIPSSKAPGVGPRNPISHRSVSRSLSFHSCSPRGQVKMTTFYTLFPRIQLSSEYSLVRRSPLGCFGSRRCLLKVSEGGLGASIVPTFCAVLCEANVTNSTFRSPLKGLNDHHPWDSRRISQNSTSWMCRQQEHRLIQTKRHRRAIQQTPIYTVITQIKQQPKAQATCTSSMR